MSPEALLETLRLHGKSSVCCIEPRDAREWAEVVAALLAAQRYTAIVPHPDAVESVDRTLELAARIVELEQEVARWKAAFEEAQQDAERVRLESINAADFNHWNVDQSKASRYGVADALADVERLKAPKSVPQDVAEANLGQRCGWCLAPKPAAELVNGECADKAACARGVQAAAGGAR